MGKEFEIKIINPDVKLFKEILRKNQGKLVHPKRKMFRHVFVHPDPKVNGFVRLRKEGDDKTTLTCKTFNKSKFPLEYELSINEPYEKGLEFLNQSGLKLKSYQETAREKWKHPLAKEIVFDNWPGIPEFIEIDCESEENLKNMIKIFDVDKKNIRYDGVDSLYEELHNISKKKFNHIPQLTFNDFQKQLLGGKKTKTRKRKLKKKTKVNIKKTNKKNKNIGKKTKKVKQVGSGSLQSFTNILKTLSYKIKNIGACKKQSLPRAPTRPPGMKQQRWKSYLKLALDINKKLKGISYETLTEKDKIKIENEAKKIAENCEIPDEKVNNLLNEVMLEMLPQVPKHKL